MRLHGITRDHDIEVSTWDMDHGDDSDDSDRSSHVAEAISGFGDNRCAEQELSFKNGRRRKTTPQQTEKCHSVEYHRQY